MSEHIKTESPIPVLLLKLTVVGALSYFSSLSGALFPELFSLLPGVDTPSGEKLIHLRALLIAVAPIGLLYLYAVRARRLELIRLTILWRLLLV